MVSQKHWSSNSLPESYFKRALHFIFSEDVDNLLKPKIKQKWVFQNPPQIFFKGLPVANVYFGSELLLVS